MWRNKWKQEGERSKEGKYNAGRTFERFSLFELTVPWPLPGKNLMFKGPRVRRGSLSQKNKSIKINTHSLCLCTLVTMVSTQHIGILSCVTEWEQQKTINIFVSKDLKLSLQHMPCYSAVVWTLPRWAVCVNTNVCISLRSHETDLMPSAL